MTTHGDLDRRLLGVDSARVRLKSRSGLAAGLGLACTALCACDMERPAVQVANPLRLAPDAATAPNVDSSFQLLGAPMLVAPSLTSFGLNAVVVSEQSPTLLRAQLRMSGTKIWGELYEPESLAADSIAWRFEQLLPGTRYEYRIVTVSGEGVPGVLYSGVGITARAVSDSDFTFAVIADTHISPRVTLSGDPIVLPPGDNSVDADEMEPVLQDISGHIAQRQPDFMLNLGDMLDYHVINLFNNPIPDASYARAAYLNYRRLLGDTLASVPHFPVLGNWDGENGCFSSEEKARSQSQRLAYVPGPAHGVYAEGGSTDEDYYAFTWGDALFVVLNVMTYTPTCHQLDTSGGDAEDWTLGAEQLSWLENTLKHAKSKWRFTFIHHTVGGKAGDEPNSRYGRGGGQAAHVGEQAAIHELLRQYGVQIFFYGHDHVFTDIVVDDVHYTLPGSAGAPWKFTEEATGYQQFWTESGYGRVHVNPERVRVDFVSRDESVLYSYDVK